jgi:lysophospholipase L1-like esterase
VRSGILQTARTTLGAPIGIVSGWIPAAQRLTIGALRQRRLSLLDSLPVRPSDLVLFGDSLVYEGDWCALFPQLSVRNLGIPGDTSRDALSRVHQVRRLTPKTSVVMFGSNDLTQRINRDETVRNIGRIVDQLGESGTSVMLMSIPPRSRRFADRIRTLNICIAKLAADRNASFVDLSDRLADNRGRLRSDLTNDGLHLLGAGYLLWRDALAPVLTPAAQSTAAAD